jgi:hypothetical protein
MKKYFLQVLGFLIGFILSAFLVFQVLFLAKVIPHGGL